MREKIKDMSVSIDELYAAAAMLGINQLTQIPRPEETDINLSLDEKGWTEEEFDGTIRLLPGIAKMIELCALPERYCEVILYKGPEEILYRIYSDAENTLCLCAYDGGYIANAFKETELMEFIANELPVSDAEGKHLTMTRDEAVEYFDQTDWIVQINYADFAVEDDSEEIAGQNWIAVCCGGVLWQLNETTANVNARTLDKKSLHSELTAVLCAKGRD